MGRWSRHPMGSDGALDAEAIFFEEAEIKYDVDFYGDIGDSEIKNYLESLSLEDLERICSEEYISEDRFVVPYIFQRYEVCVKDDIRDFLLDCFNYTDDITGEWNYCSETDENGEILELKHIRIFKENFDDVMNKKFELPPDAGLFAALFESDGTGLINKM